MLVKNLNHYAMGTLLLATVTGCVHTPPLENDPYYAPVVVAAPRHSDSLAGALFNPTTNIALFDDRRAAQVGDIITVILDEQTTSSKSAETRIDKSSSNTLPEPTLLGTQFSMSGRGAFSDLSLDTSTSQEREFEGTAEADQSNSLKGSISVVISQVYGNGNMLVKGEKWIELNRGKEFIRVSGIVRQDDVSPDNTVSSQKLANARISYSGTGDLAQSQEQGWLDKFFGSVYWPF